MLPAADEGSLAAAEVGLTAAEVGLAIDEGGLAANLRSGGGNGVEQLYRCYCFLS